jgi:MGT family glycosyltransferase
MTARVIGEIKPDIVVSDSVAFWGKLAAMKHDLPYVSSTTTFAFNKYSAKYMQKSVWDIARMMMAMPRINKQLKRLREKGYPVKSLLDIVQNDNDTNTIVYTSKYFQPCSDTFSEKYRFIGPSIRPITRQVEKTSDKTIYISMGTVNNDLMPLYKSCIKALENTDYQVIMSVGNLVSIDDFGKLPENIEVYAHVDQIAVLKKADAFVSHCGMNSVNESLYFEVPLVMLPQTTEQSGVACRVSEVGAGIKVDKLDGALCIDYISVEKFESVSEMDTLDDILNNYSKEFAPYIIYPKNFNF